ncbi:MAG TPA: oxygen-independent coproporphyrinogen III oxidase [Kofleriaceae bacterium]|nr:oxygen-independent coproporphyrinogen III oxidase [Kofleriaceae bacterium]
MELDLAERVAARAINGPRYTSYPPATRFAEIKDAQVQGALAALGANATPTSLYVHLPFCSSLCWYCGCNVVISRDRKKATPYIDTLATEAVMLAKALGKVPPITELCLGGGSPNFLSPADLQRLLSALERYLPLEPDARRSVELDPRDSTVEQLQVFREHGFQSLSVGVQDFHPAVQEAIHRHQSAEQTAQLIAAARERGWTDINIDIVYGLPRQTEETFCDTIDRIIELAPERVALFGYAHLPDRRPHQLLVEKAGRILDLYERATLLIAANKRFAAAGYVAIGLDHFAKPDSELARASAERRLTRSFQGYAPRRADAILGIGATAISTTEELIWQNGDLVEWQRAIESGHFGQARGVHLIYEDRLRRDVIMELMCTGELDYQAMGKRHHLDFPQHFAKELTQLDTMDELVTVDRAAGALRTTEIGRLLVRNVAMVFDRYLAQSPLPFSSTI